MANPVSDGGEKSLTTLLSSLTTTLHPSTFVFITLSESSTLPPLSEIQLMFRESEGITIIATQEYAVSQQMEYSFPSRMITLNVHSSLEAVGFMAVIATKLAEKGMGVNPVSGFYHDHLFVPIGKEEEALSTLQKLSEDSK
ncbi:integron gene cassette protein [Dactylonectria estremocensis]|uniref:Integron gene cassette protein n=1 Tax=Dactylonectria estremocensis TaxID=1079267 RepID=A0A9P9DH71_9HYPO|nr:integron gene cassette protein [Dactylonectria estremocensis]